ncbi:pilus assembly protein [Massilia sp. erpn]|uniref:pilus assembly protein n=1 Tax=Massilia sp. erpn TaxID=2738142 RepID=UPI0021084FF5|nr:pilus assembly protein [Massilia sp. erpn]UTY58810.1 pilus assembly protein [Massilia sp. erpn]
MNPNFLRVASVGLIFCALAACRSTTPNLDAHFGESVSLLQAQQILDPSASNRLAGPDGMDGVAAKSGYDQYQKSFKAPEPRPSTFVIGVGR